MAENAQGKSFVNTANTRPGVYDNVINQIAKEKVCPFCLEQLSTYHKNPILHEGTYWLVTDNMYPYKDTKTHLLFIHKQHLVHLSELSLEAWRELQTLTNKLIRERKIPGGTLLIRFGDTNYTGASVNHLHAHLVSSDPEKEDYAPVLARIG